MITIKLTPLSVRVPVTRGGRLIGTDLYVQKFLKRFGQESWDGRLRQYILLRRYVYYNEKSETLYFPRYAFEAFVEMLRENRLTYTVEHLPLQVGLDVEIKLKPWVKDRDERQTTAIHYLTTSDDPIRGLSLDTGCLTGDMVIPCNRGRKGFTTDLKSMYEQHNGIYHGNGRQWNRGIPTYIRAFDGTRVRLHLVKDVVYSGIKPVFKATLENGRFVICTDNHEIMTSEGFIETKALSGKLVMCDNKHTISSDEEYQKHHDYKVFMSSWHPHANPSRLNPDIKRLVIHRAVYEAFVLNHMTSIAEYYSAWEDATKRPFLKTVDPTTHDIHHKDFDHSNNIPSNLECLPREEHRALHAERTRFNFNQGVPSYSKVVSIDYVGEEPTYDIVCNEPYRNFVANGIVVHNSGKTFCLLKAASILGKRMMVCVGGLVEQWKEAILNFTELTEADIYIIQGAPSMSKLLQQIDRNLFPKIILCSLGTIRNYAVDHESYANYPPFEELLDRLQVGIKVVDEAHLNFWLTMMLDLRLNPVLTIPLSATFDRGDKQVKAIFDEHYPHLIRFGEGTINKYIDVYSYSYSLGGMVPTKAYSTPKGYNHSKFEDWLLRKDTKLEYIYAVAFGPAIFSHYVNTRRPGQKLLILCATVEMCKWFKKKLTHDLPSQENFTIELYNYGSSEDILKDSDIIISTPGSAGTGTDIKNLRTVIMTIATGSDNTNKQTLGRLRVLESTGDTPIYAYAWCRDIIPHNNYQETRRNTYTTRGKTFTEMRL